MFWGAILYDYQGSNLPYYLYPTPYETKDQLSSAVTQLSTEWEKEKAEVERFNLTPPGILNPQPLPELKERGKGRKGGIDWFIYREQIQIPLRYPFALAAQAAQPSVVIMEDNAQAHIHHYHNTPHLNPIETIWMEMKDLITERLGIRITASGIRQIVEEQWATYPRERINRHILSMPDRIEACIKDEGGNSFNF
ncbi:hypothetical protein HOY82DRAFT_603593 [Tuber indicum]|nr:hypothetical protein HOY82DRAFT_603593 [Tuber indicum]